MSNSDVQGQQYLAERRVALLKVFRAFCSRWPRFFGTDRTDELLPVWLSAVAGIDVSVLEPAAIDYAATNGGRYAPEPRIFADHARLHASRVNGSDTVYEAHQHQSTDDIKEDNRIDTLGWRAHAVLTSWSLVGEVWALLWQTAPTDDHALAVRRGLVPYDVFDEAVEAVRKGARAKPGPLAA